MPRLRSIGIAALAALLAPALFALNSEYATQNAPAPANPAVPGTLNYIEGSASLNGEAVSRKADGSATLEPGQTISTRDGRAEVLLTPGVYLRLGHNSTVKMISPDITNTAVAVENGTADVEVDQLFKENDIHIVVNRVPVQLVKTGLYEFNANNDTAMVFKGEAAIDRGGRHWTEVKAGHEVNLSEGAADVNSTKFNVNEAENSGLYRWSSLRSDYLAEANQQMAGEYGAGYAPGWYWDPYMWNYTFLGPYGFYSPFGWGFYPMGWGLGWGGWGGYYGGGFYSHPLHGTLNGRGFNGTTFDGRAIPGARADGFRSGGAFRAGGEMGGFLGGGGLGGFHGGGGFGGHGR